MSDDVIADLEKLIAASRDALLLAKGRLEGLQAALEMYKRPAPEIGPTKTTRAKAQ